MSPWEVHEVTFSQDALNVPLHTEQFLLKEIRNEASISYTYAELVRKA